MSMTQVDPFVVLSETNLNCPQLGDYSFNVIEYIPFLLFLVLSLNFLLTVIDYMTTEPTIWVYPFYDGQKYRY